MIPDEDKYDKKKKYTYSAQRTSSWAARIPVRYVLSFMVFWAFFVVYALRVNLSVAIVAMVNKTATMASLNNETISMGCSYDDNNNQSYGDDDSFMKEGEFSWDEKTQGMVLGAFFYGYVVTQVPGGRLAEKIGGKWLLCGGVFLTSLMTLLTPVSARWSVNVLIINRIITGLGEGVTYPAMYAIFSRWIPISERSIHCAVSSLGATVGTIVALPASAILSEYGFAGGWPSIFYVFGGIGCLWCLLWIFTTTSSPESHPIISYNELSYIQKNTDFSLSRNEFTSIPWKKIFTSMPVIACAITKFCAAWGFYLLLTDLPNYLNFMMHFSIEKNGWLNAIIYIAGGVTVMACGFLADVMRKRQCFSVTTIRKLFQCIALVGPAICLAVIPFVGCDRLGVIVILALAMALGGFTAGGEGPLILDMAPNFSGTIFGLTNGFSNLAGVFAPMVTGVFTQKNETIQSWGLVFYLAAIIYVVGALFFAFFGSAEVQPWSISKEYKIVQINDDELASDEDTENLIYKHS